MLEPRRRDRPRPDASEWTRYFRPHALGGVEALHANFVSHAYRPHSHPTWTIAAMRRGAAEFTVDGTPHRARAGELFVLEPEAVHTGLPGVPEGWAYQVLYLPPAIVGEWARPGRGGPATIDAVVFRDPALRGALDRLHGAIGAEHRGLEIEVDLALAARALGRHLRTKVREPGRRPEHAAVRRAVELLRSRWDRTVTLTELAHEARLSRYELVRCFSAQVGLPPHAFQIDLRVNRARALLRDGEPPAVVAAACGFADQAHLTRTFKRSVGTTPRRYADAHA
jgi:AraC-like DNA-binding protein